MDVHTPGFADRSLFDAVSKRYACEPFLRPCSIEPRRRPHLTAAPAALACLCVPAAMGGDRELVADLVTAAEAVCAGLSPAQMAEMLRDYDYVSAQTAD